MNDFFCLDKRVSERFANDKDQSAEEYYLISSYNIFSLQNNSDNEHLTLRYFIHSFIHFRGMSSEKFH